MCSKDFLITQWEAGCLPHRVLLKIVPLNFWKIMFRFTLVLHLSADFTRSTTRKSATQIPATDSSMTLTHPFVTTTRAGTNCSTLWLRATRAMRASATHEPSASSSSSLSWPIWPSPSHGSEVLVLQLSPHLYPGLFGCHQAMEVKSLSSGCLISSLKSCQATEVSISRGFCLRVLRPLSYKTEVFVLWNRSLLCGIKIFVLQNRGLCLRY